MQAHVAKRDRGDERFALEGDFLASRNDVGEKLTIVPQGEANRAYELAGGLNPIRSAKRFQFEPALS
jgi:hypothetical protein